MASDINIKNKRAAFEYEILEKYIAGLVLCGTEIKSVRQGKVSLPEAYCFFAGRELWIKAMNIAVYEYGSVYNHEPTRDRKLLLNNTELRKIKRKIEEKGLSVIPLRLFINEKGLAKLEIAVGRGKKLHDKRESIKKRDTDKTMRRALVR